MLAEEADPFPRVPRDVGGVATLSHPEACGVMEASKATAQGPAYSLAIYTRTASPGVCIAGAYNSETSHSLSMISAQSVPHTRLFQVNAAE